MSNEIRRNSREVGRLSNRKAYIDDGQARGGLRVVKTAECMFKIPKDMRKLEMEVAIQDVGEKYKLISLPHPTYADTTIVNWQLIGHIPPECSRTVIYVDDLEGDDIEATVTPCIHFKTMEGAKDFIVTNNLYNAHVVFLAGDYTHVDTNWAIDLGGYNVSYEFKKSVNIIHTGGTNDYIFHYTRDSNSVIIKGDATIIADGSGGSSICNVPIYIEGPRCDVDVELKYVGAPNPIYIVAPDSTNIAIEEISISGTTSKGITMITPDDGQHKFWIGTGITYDNNSLITIEETPSITDTSMSITIDVELAVLKGSKVLNTYTNGDGLSSNANIELTVNKITVDDNPNMSYAHYANGLYANVVANVYGVTYNKSDKFTALKIDTSVKSRPYIYTLNLIGTTIGYYAADVQPDVSSYLTINGTMVNSAGVRGILLVRAGDVSKDNQLSVVSSVTGDLSSSGNCTILYELQQQVKSLILMNNNIVRPVNLQHTVSGVLLGGLKQFVDMVGTNHLGDAANHVNIDWRRVTDATDVHYYNTTSDIEIYVSQSGDDYTGNGLVATPYQTISGALRRMPRIVNGAIIVNIVGTVVQIAEADVSKYLSRIYAKNGITIRGTVLDTGIIVNITAGSVPNEFVPTIAMNEGDFLEIGGELLPIGLNGGKYYLPIDFPGALSGLTVYRINTQNAIQNVFTPDSLSAVTITHIKLSLSVTNDQVSTIGHNINYISCGFAINAGAQLDMTNIRSISNSYIAGDAAAGIIVKSDNKDSILENVMFLNTSGGKTAVQNVTLDKVCTLSLDNLVAVDNEKPFVNMIRNRVFVIDPESIFNCLDDGVTIVNIDGIVIATSVDQIVKILPNSEHNKININNCTSLATPYNLVGDGSSISISAISTKYNYLFDTITRHKDAVTDLLVVPGVEDIVVGDLALDEVAEVTITSKLTTVPGVVSVIKCYISSDSVVGPIHSGSTVIYSYGTMNFTVASVVIGNDMAVRYTNTDTGANNHRLEVEITRVKRSNLLSVS